jgi:hypothetical protein
MITEQTLITVVTVLNTVSQENLPSIRLGLLNKYLSSEELSEEEKELLNVVLSFQVSHIFSAYKPRFNAIPFEGFGKHFSAWFNHQTRDTFYTLPYIIQTFIYYLTSPKTLRLSTERIATTAYAYHDPFTFMIDYVEYTEEPSECPLCCTPNETAELCKTCMGSLEAFTVYRIVPSSLQ